MKKCALAWAIGDKELGIDGKPLPTFDEIKRIIHRDVEDDDSETQKRLEEILDWWVDSIIPAIAGNHLFPERVRRQHTVSLAPMPNDQDKLAVHATTEALAGAMWDNCLNKWSEMKKYRVDEGNKGPFPKYCKNNQETHRFKAKYSDNASGNSPYGGWNIGGLELFEDLTEEIEKLRDENDEMLKEVEEAVCKRLQTKYEQKLTDEGKKPAARKDKKKAAATNKTTAALQRMKKRRRMDD